MHRWVWALLLLTAACQVTAAPRPARLAVVMPFAKNATHKVARNFAFWTTNVPCTLRRRAHRVHVTFIFHYAYFIDAAVQAQLEALWAAAPHACFDDVLYLSANHTEAQEAFGPTIGGCHQHYATFFRLHALGFEHWLQLEPDVVPVRSGWLTRIVEEVHANRKCVRWWVQGSAASYEAPRISQGERTDGVFLNGNALYCVNAAVLAYLRDVLAQFPFAGCYGACTLKSSARPVRPSRRPAADASRCSAAAAGARCAVGSRGFRLGSVPVSHVGSQPRTVCGPAAPVPPRGLGCRLRLLRHGAGARCRGHQEPEPHAGAHQAVF